LKPNWKFRHPAVAGDLKATCPRFWFLRAGGTIIPLNIPAGYRQSGQQREPVLPARRPFFLDEMDPAAKQGIRMGQVPPKQGGDPVMKASTSSLPAR